ncbi:MAG: T9SS type A sorting domain-containing protein [Fluviicola sp.]|nr:T9SS type A sorting domain-containing protein [Fluviicola sp.]
MKTKNPFKLITLLLIPLFLILSITNLSAQCPSGAIGVTGAGCGCLSGCNLTSLGGPNCSPAVSGNCSAGNVSMSFDITVPNGCTITVNATMANRAGGCTASGADGGTDGLKVDIPGGPKPLLTGASNATVTDSYVLAGPGTIRISGIANRADEIITYTSSSTGCVNCVSSLPVELLRFEVSKNDQAVICNWETGSELNCDYFIIERSSNGIDFEPIGQMDGAGTSTQTHTYTLYDSSPIDQGVSYYRLAQTDFDGTIAYSETKSVNFSAKTNVTVVPNPSTGTFSVIGKHIDLTTLSMRNVFGQSLQPMQINELDEETILQYSDLPVGIYFLTYENNRELVTERIIVSH